MHCLGKCSFPKVLFGVGSPVSGDSHLNCKFVGLIISTPAILHYTMLWTYVAGCDKVVSTRKLTAILCYCKSWLDCVQFNKVLYSTKSMATTQFPYFYFITFPKIQTPPPSSFSWTKNCKTPLNDKENISRYPVFSPLEK